MRIYTYTLGNNTCVWAQLDERDVARLLLRGGFASVARSHEKTPDFERGNCVVELKCIEVEPLFPNGKLRYIVNRRELVQSITATPLHGEGTFQLTFKMDPLLRRAEQLVRAAKHQLRAAKALGRITGVIVVNNASFTISGRRTGFATALRRAAAATGAIDFVIFLNVFSQTSAKPRIDLIFLPCREHQAVNMEMNGVVELLKSLPDLIQETAKAQKAKPHKPPTITINYNEEEIARVNTTTNRRSSD